MSVTCFMVARTEWAAVYARRYVSGSICSSRNGYHDALGFIGYFPIVWKDGGPLDPDSYMTFAIQVEDIHEWPKTCDCGYIFNDKDVFQLFDYEMYAVPTEAAVFAHLAKEWENPKKPLDPCVNQGWWQSANLPAGSMYWRYWANHHPYWDNGGDKSLIVVCPDKTHWDIDSRTSNCGLKEDRIHRCWVRHGEPPNITVNKEGNTCVAGAGSIRGQNGYHGHLVNGALHRCDDSTC